MNHRPIHAVAVTLFALSCLQAQHHVFTFHGDAAGDSFGTSVSNMGDLNKDGFADVLVGAPNASIGNVKVGIARIHSGKDGNILLEVAGKTGLDKFGESVTGMGDVDGDGVPDFAVGASWAPYQVKFRLKGPGTAYIVSGKTGRFLHSFVGLTGNDASGITVANIGDVDKDGRSDLAVAFQSQRTRVAVYSSKTGTWLYDMPSVGFSRTLGTAIASIGDIDQDGLPDFVVGDPTASSSAGAYHLVSGKTGGLIYSIRGQSGVTTWLGQAIASAGDLDNDGIPDYVVGAPLARPTTNFIPGAAFVVSGKTGFRSRILYGKVESGHFGRSLAAVGDVNGDKVIDFAVGMKTETHASRGQGAVQVFSGKDLSLLATFIGDDPGDDFGFSVASLGDVNGDGITDLVAGSPQDDDNGLSSGSARVVSTSRLSLMSLTRSVSILRREKQILDLDAGPGNAGKVYLVLGTAGSIRPGIRIGNVTLPLSLDPYLMLTLERPSAVIYNNFGKLDAKGRGKVAFVLPGNVSAWAGGLLLRHAYIVFGAGGIEFASNAVPVELRKF